MLNVGTQRLDPQGATVWKEGCGDIWRAQGVWDVDDAGVPRIRRPAHFARADFRQDFLKPFSERFAAGIHAAMPAAHIFVEAEPFMPPPKYESADKLVYAPHFYEGMTLFTRRFHPQLNFDLSRFRPLIGERAIRAYLSRQFGRFRQFADEAMGDVPIVIGEFGIPFDMNGAEAYDTGDFTRQAQALDYNLRALDDSLLSYTLWNYTPDNSNARGELNVAQPVGPVERQQPPDPHGFARGHFGGVGVGLEIHGCSRERWRQVTIVFRSTGGHQGRGPVGRDPACGLPSRRASPMSTASPAMAAITSATRA